MPSPSILLHLLLPLVSATALLHPDQQTLDQHQVCSYQSDSRSVRCRCQQNESRHFLPIQLESFLKKDNPKVDQVSIEFCTELLLAIDLSGVTSTNIHLKLSNCGKVQIVNIKYDPENSGEKKLNLELENMEKFTIQKQTFAEATTITATNVKELLIYKTTFSHLSNPGIKIEKSAKVSIIDCVFNETSPGSISVNSVDEVEIINNQFSINTIEVVELNDFYGSNLYISCNRLHEEAVNLECVTISSALHTVSSATSFPASFFSSLTSASMDVKSERQGSSSVNTILWVLVAVGLVVLTAVFICVCCRGRQDKKKSDEEKNSLKSNIETERQEVDKDYEKEVMLTPDIETSVSADTIKKIDKADIIEKVKEQEAILHCEIQELRVNLGN
eukprot:GFUD01105617.1.p1 GENE.GFUD01105617.1~~GFUD01105617.1.p1  ORF type:complete len:389 (+),score=113.83 GFUD01105617.1:309-1475(+)